MEKLNDYSGQLKPYLKFTDFSTEGLVKLLKLYSKLYTVVDGFWYLTVKERMGNDEALACDIQVWEKLCRYEMKKATEQFNIQGNDVVALMKAMQVTPWYWNMEYKMEIQDHRSAMYTVTRCSTLEALVKEGEGREHQICKIVEPRLLKGYASFFNPDIEITCLKEPSLESNDGICCQWKFALEK